MNYSELINADILKTSVTFSKNTWKRYGVVIALLILVYLLFAVVAFGFLGSTIFSQFDPSVSDPNAISEMMESFFSNLLERDSIFIIFLGILIIYAISFLISSWLYNLFFLISKNEYENSGISFSNIFSTSFNNTIFRILGLMFLSLLISLVFFSPFTLSRSLMLSLIDGPFTSFFSLLFYIAMSIIFIRLILTIPRIVIAGKGIFQSLKFSWKSIGTIKALKYFLLMLLGGLLLFIIMITSMIIPWVLGVFGVFILIPLMFIFNVFITSFVIGLISALYYRNSGDLDQLNNVEPDYESHLVE